MSAKLGIPGVNNAVQKLEGLAGRMSSGRFGFRTNDVNNINMVIDALYQLESERKKMHVTWETESIIASRHRYRMNDDIAATYTEMWDLVQVTEATNAQELSTLKETLAQKKGSITVLEKSACELEGENKLLQSEFEMLQKRHVKVLDKSSQQMNEKTQELIVLNDLRRDERDLHVAVMTLEESIIQIQNDMILERQAARRHIDPLVQELTELRRETENLYRKTRVKKRQLKPLKVQYDHNHTKLMDTEDYVAELKAGKAALSRETWKLKQQYSERNKKIDSLRSRRQLISDIRAADIRWFDRKEKILLDNIKKFEAEIETESALMDRLEETKKLLMPVCIAKEDRRKCDARRLDNMTGQLARTQTELTKMVNGIVRMKKENIDMEAETNNTADYHASVVCKLNRQIQRMTAQLAGELDLDSMLSEEAERTRSSLNELTAEEIALLKEMRKSIQGILENYSDLKNEGARLQQEIADADERIRKLKDELTKAQRCPAAEEQENRIRNMLVSHEVMQDGISGRIQKRRELQLILGAKKKVLQQERDMVEDEDSEAYFEHVQRLNACTDEHTDPMWWGLDQDTMDALNKLREEHDVGSCGLITSVAGVDIIMGLTQEETNELMKTTKMDVAVKSSKSDTGLTRPKPVKKEKRSKSQGPGKKLQTVAEFVREVSITDSQEDALRWIALGKERREECKMLEEAQETKRRELKERLRTVQELQKTFDERVKNYSEKFADPKLLRHLEGQVRTAREELDRAHRAVAFVRKRLLKKRWRMLYQMEQNGNVRKAKEQKIFSVTCKIRTIMDANDKFENHIKRLQNDCKDIEIRMDENTELTQTVLPAKLAKLKEDLATMIRAGFQMLAEFISKSEMTADEYDLYKKDECYVAKRASIIEPIIVQLKQASTTVTNRLRQVLPRPPPGEKTSWKRERKNSKEGGQSRSKKERLSESKIERLSESKKGVQSESQKGVQSESKKGVQSESQKGVQREPEKGELSEPQKGVLSESKKGVQSQSKKGVQSESKKRVQSKSKKGLQIKRQTFRRNTVPPVFFADVSPSSSSSDDSKPNSGDTQPKPNDG